MAQKTLIELVDDLHGGPATQTVTFSLDRKDLEIDLDDDNAERLRAALAEYIPHARWVAGRKPRKRGATTASTAKATPPAFSGSAPSRRVELDPPAADIRAWAKTQPDIDLAPRGRIPEEVKEKYRKASRKRGRAVR